MTFKNIKTVAEGWKKEHPQSQEKTNRDHTGVKVKTPDGIGTIEVEFKRPTFSQMVPYSHEIYVNLDSGKNKMFPANQVKVIKTAKVTEKDLDENIRAPKYGVKVGQIYIPADGSKNELEVLAINADTEEATVFDKAQNKERSIDLFKLAKVRYSLAVRDRKTGRLYNPDEEFNKTMHSPEVMAQMKRMKNGNVKEQLDKEDYHLTLVKPFFEKNKIIGGNKHWAHDLSDGKNKPMLVTIKDEKRAEDFAKQLGAEVFTTPTGTFRLFKKVVKEELSAYAEAFRAKLIGDKTIAETEHPHETVYTDFDDWKNAVRNSYPTYAARMRFNGRMEGGKTTISAEIAGLDRCFGVWDQDTDKGHVLAESEDWGSLSKSEFKRRELRQELGLEVPNSPIKKPRGMSSNSAPGVKKFGLKINGKLWSKEGKPVEFASKMSAEKAGTTLSAKGKKFEAVPL